MHTLQENSCLLLECSLLLAMHCQHVCTVISRTSLVSSQAYVLHQLSCVMCLSQVAQPVSSCTCQVMHMCCTTRVKLHMPCHACTHFKRSHAQGLIEARHGTDLKNSALLPLLAQLWVEWPHSAAQRAMTLHFLVLLMVLVSKVITAA